MLKKNNPSGIRLSVTTQTTELIQWVISLLIAKGHYLQLYTTNLTLFFLRTPNRVFIHKAVGVLE